MSLGIEYKPFNKLVKKIIDNRGKTCPVARSGFPLIATNCILNRNLYPIFENIRFVSQETYETWFRGHPEPGDMIFVLKGTPGRVNWVPDQVNFCIAQDMVAIRANEQEVYPKYLFAALRSSIIQQEIENLHVGTLIPHFKKSDFDKLFIPCPSYKMQTYIGDTYFYFSQKIDLLQRQNATLEAMAETLFRQWFIEEAQEDWEEYPLSSFIEIIGGGTPKTSEESYWNGDILWMSGGDIASSHKSFIFDTDKKISSEGLENSSAKLLPKFSTVITARGTVGKICLLGEQAAFSQTNYGILPRIAGTPFFTFLLMSDLLCYLKQSAYGSVFDTITRSTFEEIKFNCSTDNYIVNFENMISPFFQKIFSNCRQIRTLEKLRDTLLPKLMSGEVRVRVDG